MLGEGDSVGCRCPAVGSCVGLGGGSESFGMGWTITAQGTVAHLIVTAPAEMQCMLTLSLVIFFFGVTTGKLTNIKDSFQLSSDVFFSLTTS